MTDKRRRGRKNKDIDLSAFINDTRAVGFVPSRITREQMVYCMRESGVHSKSAVLALAIKNFHDMLLAEARRRLEAENYDIATPIGPSGFIPNLDK